MKELISHKIVIEFENGRFRDGVFLYRIKIDGILSKGYKSIAIKNMGFSIPQMNGILNKVKSETKNIENIKRN